MNRPARLRIFTRHQWTWWAQQLLAAIAVLTAVVVLATISPQATLAPAAGEFLPTAPNVAVGMLLLGISLSILAIERRRLAALLATIPFVYGAIASLEYVFGWHLGLATLSTWNPVEGVHMHPSLPAAIVFALSGAGFWLAGTERSPHRPLVVALVGGALVALGAVAIVAYSSGIAGTYPNLSYGRMSAGAAWLGILIGVGLVLQAWRDEAPASGMPRWIPLLIGISGVVGTLILWQAVAALERAHIQQLVNAKAAEMRDAIEVHIQMRAAALERMARRWESGARPDRGAWEQDAMLHFHDYGGYKAIQWVDRDFRIRWVVPHALNAPLIDLNSAFDQARRQALLEARDRRVTTMTSAISLVTGGMGFRIHSPLFRDSRFDGFMVGVIQTDNFFDLVLQHFLRQGYEVELRDGERPVYRSVTRDLAPSYRDELALRLPQPTWHLTVAPQAKLVQQLQSPLPSLVVGGGFIISLALSFLAYMAHTARLRNLRLQHEIREREAKEKILQQSEARFRSVTESATDAIISADVNGKILSWNYGAQRIFGYTANEILGKPLGLLMPERYRAAHDSGMARIARGEPGRLAGNVLELEGVRKDGKVFPLEISIATWKVDGEVLCSGIVRDITDRRRNERVLRERERQLASAEKIAHLGSWEWDIGSNRVTWSDELYRIYGEEPQAELVNYESFLARIHADDRTMVEEKVSQAYRDATPLAFDHRIVRSDGAERILHVVGEVIVDERGKAVRMTGAAQDITDQVQADELLREAAAVRKSEQHFRLLADSAPVLIWMCDRDGAAIYFNQPWIEFTGRALEEQLGEGWLDSWHPDEREQVVTEYRKAHNEQQAFRVEHRLRHADGRYRWVLNHGVPRFVNTEFIGFIGSCVDIHARKQAEEERAGLLAAEQRARAEAEHARNRIAFVAEASQLLTQTLDYERALADFARAAVPRITDWCAVDLVTEDGKGLRRVQVAHQDPDKVKLAFELSQNYPPDPELPHGAFYVFRSGKIDWMADIPREMIDRSVRDARHRELLAMLDLRSYVVAPLISRGRMLGVITFVMAESGRHYNEEDVKFIESLARRCAVAVDNARLYRLSQDELSERLRAEASLAAEKERLAVTLYSIGDGVITVDTAGRVVLLNKVAEQLTGWTQADAGGKPLTEVFHIVHEKTRKLVSSPVDEVLRSGGVAALANHTVLIARDGRERAIADSGAPIRDSAGNIIGVVLVFRDVTEQQRMEQELAKGRNLEAIGLLAGGIAHDFNNILTAILGNIALAKMYGEGDSKITDVLGEAEKAFWRARDLTQQLLTFAKGGAPIKKTASVRELLTDTTNFALRGSNVRVDFDIANDLWAAEFDRGQLSQVINNLVLNAKQAMPGGGKLRIRAQNLRLKGGEIPLPPGPYLHIEVSDTGAGIPEKHLAKIFDPYFTTKQQGSGLGLSIAYSIITKHQGHITVRSTIGVGTTFNIYLPATPNAKLAAERASEDGAPDGHGRRVLVMDDELQVRNVLGGLLKGMGYDVAFAHDGNEVLHAYAEALRKHNRFDVVIMDLTVPGGMGGKECIAKLREIDPDVRAIVSSGYSNDPVMADYGAYGFRGVVAKPYQVKELGAVLRSVAADR